MKNINYNSQNEMEMLLKQCFLDLDFDKPKNEKLMEIVSAHFIGNTSASVISQSKNINFKIFLSKLGWPVFAGIILISSYFIWTILNKPVNTSVVAEKHSSENSKNFITERENQNKELTTTQEVLPSNKKSNFPSITFPLPLNDSIEKFEKDLKQSGSNKINPTFVDTGDSFPVLTEKEIAANNKRKKKMIDQLAKQSKSKYSLIPMGSFIYKNDKFSVQSFYMQTTEVSNIEYRTFLIDLIIQKRKEDLKKAGPTQKMWQEKFKGKSFNQPMVDMYFTHAAFDEYPVVNISRGGAESYCKWLTHETNEHLKTKGKRYINDHRLPYDIEWAYAAQGGYGRVKYANSYNDLRNKPGHYLQNYSCQTKDSSFYDSETKLIMPIKANYVADGALHTASGNGIVYHGSPKGKRQKMFFPPNNYGLYHMAGNVSEMVYVFDKKNKSSKMPGTKGGSWFSVDYYLEIDADEEFPEETGPSPMIGFRPVFTFEEKN